MQQSIKLKPGQEPTFQRKQFSAFNRLIVLIAVLILVIVLLSHAGSFLILNAPEHADAILVLGAENSYRHAVKLQNQGYADRILLDASAIRMMYGKSEADLAIEFLNRTSPRLAEVCPTIQDSTYGEAADVKRCLARLSISSVLIVASDFHTRLALSIFQKRLPQYHWSVAAASAPYHDADQWWKHRAWAKTVLDEWEKFIWWQVVDRWRPGRRAAVREDDRGTAQCTAPSDMNWERRNDTFCVQRPEERSPSFNVVIPYLRSTA
jgi:uncharacterized SAM-binding protein YcdF (DUF218 family)